jgi:cytochrome c oxidase assembly protein subunit 15
MNTSAPIVKLWLWLVAALIACMVIVGGATRLTDSGLSITEWRPLLGAIPPLTEASWLEAFEKYKQIPEFKIQNHWMALEDFKTIYWWEWAHRFLGRFIGVAFIIPLLFFVATGRIAKSLWPKLLLLFVVGGLQGALGWFMVASGLSERTDVSQYRLAAHLSLAFLLFAAVVFTALRFNNTTALNWKKSSVFAALFIALLFVQIAAGGFVAGLDAGHASYTWPKMNDSWVPTGMSTLQPLWKNWFDNALAVQFNHRFLAYLIVLLALAQAFWLRRKSAVFVLAAVLSQATLGIMTVLSEVQLHTALTHQGGALVVLALALWHFVSVTREPAPGQR